MFMVYVVVLAMAGFPLVAGSLLVMLLIVSASMLMIAPFALAAGLGSDPAVRAQLVAFSVVFSVLGGSRDGDTADALMPAVASRLRGCDRLDARTARELIETAHAPSTV